tara:strand:- start:170 stop:337 length:168 start_codon:yes stop_codon:yes gene_type:complete
MSWKEQLHGPFWEHEKQQVAKLEKEIKELELEIEELKKKLASLKPKRVSDAGSKA